MSGPRQFAALTRVVLDAFPIPFGLLDRCNEELQTRKEILMTRTTPTTTAEPKQPDFYAWHVTNKGDDSFWTKVGAAWPHRDGKGLSLQLDVMPMNGRIVLRQPSVNTGDQRAGAWAPARQGLSRSKQFFKRQPLFGMFCRIISLEFEQILNLPPDGRKLRSLR